MDENEIKRQLNSCDAEIKQEYYQFHERVALVGQEAQKAMESYRILATIIPIGVGIVIWLIFSVAGHAFLGFLCLAIGIYAGVKLNQSTNSNIQSVRNAKSSLDAANKKTNIDV